MGYLKLWKWIEEGRGHAGAGEGATHKLSNRQQEQRLRDQFVNPRKVREWRDVYAQLHTVAAEQGWRLNGSPATYEQVHRQLGLDQPLAVQFGRYLAGLAHGDLGRALLTGNPVVHDLARVLPATVELATLAMLIGALV